MRQENIQRVIATAVVLVAIAALPPCSTAQGSSNNHEVKNVIIMVADGMGLANTHATPAAFGAHLQKRSCETEIARQYVEETQPDVLLGAGWRRVGRDWIAASPARRQHTLLIVLADHETAGFAVMGTEAPGAAPLGYFYPGWTFGGPEGLRSAPYGRGRDDLERGPGERGSRPGD